jgi:hypothetical protein
LQDAITFQENYVKNKTSLKEVVKSTTSNNKKKFSKMNKQEPIIWEKQHGSLIDFYQVANGLELNHIIYVIDAMGELDSVWATAAEDIIECLYEFSNKCFFGRIQKIEDAIEYGFFDEVKINNNLKINNNGKI